MPHPTPTPASRTDRSRIALVTGAGRGIGAATAAELLRRGWWVALLGRRPIDLEPFRAAAPDGRAITILADVTDPQQVEAAFRRLDAELGPIDVLVNNAGAFGPTGPIDEIDPREWQSTLDANLTGAFLCSREAFARMRTRGGRIISNGSISARRPRPHTAAYAASKHGLAGLTKTIALDGRPFGITATQIDLGNAATGLLDAAGISANPLQADGRRIPEPSFDVAEAARAIAYLAELPPQVTVHEFVLAASGMPFDGRG